MSFKLWKQRSQLLSQAKHNCEKNKCADIERACAAAYRAGQRSIEVDKPMTHVDCVIDTKALDNLNNQVRNIIMKEKRSGGILA